MENTFFRLSNFRVEQNYLKLMKYFVSMDYYNSWENKYLNSKENPKIILLEDDFINGKKDEIVTIEVEKEFERDFLLFGINNIFKNELNDFKYTCIEKGFVTKQLKEGYALEIKNELNIIESEILKLSFLSKKVQILLLKQISLFKSELKLYINNPYPKLINKLNVKSKRATIEAIFYLIYKDKKFDKATIADVGRVIDSCFRYEESSGNYKDILRANSHLAELEAMGEPSKLVQKQLKKELEKLIKLLS